MHPKHRSIFLFAWIFIVLQIGIVCWETYYFIQDRLYGDWSGLIAIVLYPFSAIIGIVGLLYVLKLWRLRKQAPLTSTGFLWLTLVLSLFFSIAGISFFVLPRFVADHISPTIIKNSKEKELQDRVSEIQAEYGELVKTLQGPQYIDHISNFADSVVLKSGIEIYPLDSNNNHSASVQIISGDFLPQEYDQMKNALVTVKVEPLTLSVDNQGSPIHSPFFSFSQKNINAVIFYKGHLLNPKTLHNGLLLQEYLKE